MSWAASHILDDDKGHRVLGYYGRSMNLAVGSATDLKIVPHLHSLDALRGLAALSVVFWHWQHFFYGTGSGTTIEFAPERQPFYALFRAFYTDGWRAVDLFFCLSGFIFYWLYAERISQRHTTAREFVVLRFSRLYPLHLATLLFVAGAQFLILRGSGSFLVFPHNDVYHFALQTVLASGWGFEKGLSFNGPAWSVSVEILLYALFFVLCLFRLRGWWHLVLLVVAGLWMTRTGLVHQELGRGLTSFFVGGIASQAFARLLPTPFSRLTAYSLAALTGLMWIVVPHAVRDDLLAHVYQRYLRSEALDFHGADVVGKLLSALTKDAYELLLFPLTVLALALWEAKGGGLGQRLAPLGHISYSSYLLHFPLQITFAGIALLFSVPSAFFCTPQSLLLFFLVLLSISWASYRYFERPCQSLIRAACLRKR